MKYTRPDMRDYFKASIANYTHGMLSPYRGHRVWPNGVKRIDGNVTDQIITVTMEDGSVYKWSGGRYSSRKINLCYAPLMPKPIKETN